MAKPSDPPPGFIPYSDEFAEFRRLVGKELKEGDAWAVWQELLKHSSADEVLKKLRPSEITMEALGQIASSGSTTKLALAGALASLVPGLGLTALLGAAGSNLLRDKRTTKDRLKEMLGESELRGLVGEDNAAEPQQERSAFARALENHRKAAGLSQEQLAFLSGITQSQISKLERGTFEPKLPTIRALAKALNIRTADLVPEE